MKYNAELSSDSNVSFAFGDSAFPFTVFFLIFYVNDYTRLTIVIVSPVATKSEIMKRLTRRVPRMYMFHRKICSVYRVIITPTRVRVTTGNNSRSHVISNSGGRGGHGNINNNNNNIIPHRFQFDAVNTSKVQTLLHSAERGNSAFRRRVCPNVTVNRGAIMTCVT